MQAGKNIFMEKPVATDAPGVRRVLAAAEEAKKKDLKVGVGLQRRHSGRLSRNDQAAAGRRDRRHHRDAGLLERHTPLEESRAKLAAAKARPDRVGIPDAELVLLRLDLRRPYRRAAHPQSRRGALGQRRAAGQRQRLGRRADPQGRPTMAKSSTITRWSWNMPTARGSSANAGIFPAAGTAFPRLPMARRGLARSVPRRSTSRAARPGGLPSGTRIPIRSNTTTCLPQSARTRRTTKPSAAPRAR